MFDHGTGPPLIVIPGVQGRWEWLRPALDALTPRGHVARVHLTMTDDHPWAQAFVVIEAIPDQLI